MYVDPMAALGRAIDAAFGAAVVPVVVLTGVVLLVVILTEASAQLHRRRAGALRSGRPASRAGMERVCGAEP
jgi:hypothetical protein